MRIVSYCVQLVKTQRLTCMSPFFGYHLTLKARNLRSTFDLDISVVWKYMFRQCVSTRETGGVAFELLL